jgi:hypothetical protein
MNCYISSFSCAACFLFISFKAFVIETWKLSLASGSRQVQKVKVNKVVILKGMSFGTPTFSM